MTASEQARFSKHILKTRGCWIWKSRNRCGRYGGFYLKRGRKRTHYAHRIAYEIENGPIPPGKYVLHKCDNPLCVKPSHLFLGTQKDNLQDMVRKGRSRRGHKHYASRFTPAQIRDIRRKARTKRRGIQQRLAEQYGVYGAQISKIVLRKIYA